MEQDTYAIVELMGHQMCAGRVWEQDKYGTKGLLVEVASGDGAVFPMWHGPGAIYRVTEVPKEMADAFAKRNRHLLYQILPQLSLPTPSEAMTELSKLTGHYFAGDERDEDELTAEQESLVESEEFYDWVEKHLREVEIDGLNVRAACEFAFNSVREAVEMYQAQEDTEASEEVEPDFEALDAEKENALPFEESSEDASAEHFGIDEGDQESTDIPTE